MLSTWRFLVAAAALFGANAAINEISQNFMDLYRTRENVVELDSGVMYKVIRAGGGAEHPEESAEVQITYAGTTPRQTPTAVDIDEANWTAFDNLYTRGMAATVHLNKTMAGWTEVLTRMVTGDKWEVVIPPKLGYTDAARANTELGDGSQDFRNDTLIFRMELISIKGDTTSANTCDVLTLESCSADQKTLIKGWRENPDLEDIAKKIRGILDKKGAKYGTKKRIMQEDYQAFEAGKAEFEEYTREREKEAKSMARARHRASKEVTDSEDKKQKRWEKAAKKRSDLTARIQEEMPKMMEEEAKFGLEIKKYELMQRVINMENVRKKKEEFQAMNEDERREALEIEKAQDQDKHTSEL